MGKIPAARQAAVKPAYQSDPPVPAQELLTIIGRRSGRGCPPSSLVGAKIHCAASIRSASLQVYALHPCAAIQRAPGATPTVGVSPAPLAMIVPIVWVPSP